MKKMSFFLFELRVGVAAIAKSDLGCLRSCSGEALKQEAFHFFHPLNLENSSTQSDLAL